MAAPHYQIIRRPIITEKGLGVKETQHTVVFEVSAAATKTEIKEAVQQIFKVKVDNVRTANFVGKMRRRGQNEGDRRHWKKAYVKLAEGEKMIEYAENLYSGNTREEKDADGKRQRWDVHDVINTR